jgi:hypothetical protein
MVPQVKTGAAESSQVRGRLAASSLTGPNMIDVVTFEVSRRCHVR